MFVIQILLTTVLKTLYAIRQLLTVCYFYKDGVITPRLRVRAPAVVLKFLSDKKCANNKENRF